MNTYRVELKVTVYIDAESAETAQTRVNDMVIDGFCERDERSVMFTQIVASEDVGEVSE